MFPEGIIVLCGIQMQCKGDLATGEVIFDDGMEIPSCKKCGEAFDSETQNV